MNEKGVGGGREHGDFTLSIDGDGDGEWGWGC